MQDTIIKGKTRARRQFCSYYTESDPILSYMVARLEIAAEDIILEPCAGAGAFIAKILDWFPEQSYRIEALDLNPKAVITLNEIFQQDNIQVRKADALFDLTLDLYSNCNGFYTKIIGNPPYGAWQQHDRRKRLKKKYGGYVRETYTLFIRRAIDLLRKNGKLVFIVPDSFLALHVHKDTRAKILNETTVEEIALIPANFFPKVNFGYANLCILTLRKAKPRAAHNIKIVQVKSTVENLYQIMQCEYDVSDYFEEAAQNSIAKSTDYSFYIGANTKMRKLLNSAPRTLGDLAHCVTGFCSGDNKKFYRQINLQKGNAKDIAPLCDTDIEFDYLGKADILNGLAGAKRYIPIVKGGARMFTRKTDCYVLWDKQTVDFYRADKKARFQNAQFYFREGIGVPMVKSKKPKAFLLDKRIFDQSIVGVFPKDDDILYYLLAFLNSDVCNRMIRVINHTANNSANYLKKLPVIISQDHFYEVDQLARQAVSCGHHSQIIKRIDAIFDEIYQL